MAAVVKSKKTDTLEDYHFFSSPIYKINKLEFLDTVKSVSDESVQELKSEIELDELYPVYMSQDLTMDPRMQEFTEYVLTTAWNILNAQGYAMELYNVYPSAMWLQEHHKLSGMEQHVHSEGSQLIAFYFTEVPVDSSKFIIHDPRPGKVQLDLLQKNRVDLNESSKMVVITPEVGDLFFTNAYLPHSFSKNASDSPVKFIHINIGSARKPPEQCDIDSKPEII